MSDREPDESSHALRGAVDRGALIDFRDSFLRLEPLASGELSDFTNPDSLAISFSDGIGAADGGQFDVVWTTKGDYSLHYTDDADQNFRWDRHPNEYPNVKGVNHFHPAPDATNSPNAVEESCITVNQIVLVARALQKLWRSAYAAGSVAGINDIRDPP